MASRIASPTSLQTHDRRPRPKSSSERGRKFRARQRQREGVLKVYLADLQEQIQSLHRSRLLQLESLTRLRHTTESPHVRTIQELFTVCQDGLEGDASTAHRAHQIQFKERYLRYVFDPDTIAGDLQGVDAVIHQWRLYTIFHDRFHVDMSRIEAVGDDENPTFHLYAKLTVRIARQTFESVFPDVLPNEGIVQKYLHRLVEYDSVIWLRFSPDGRINYFSVNVNFVDGLLRAGGTIDEVARMLEHSTITPSCTFREDDPPTIIAVE